MTAEDKIKEYAKSIGLDKYSEFNVDSLIESHNRLRQLNKDLQVLRQEAFDTGREAGKAFALEHDYLSIEKLRTMTLEELATLLVIS